MGIKDIPKLPGEIARIRYDAYVDAEIGVIDGHYEALQDSTEDYKDPPLIPSLGIAIIFPDEEEDEATAQS